MTPRPAFLYFLAASAFVLLMMVGGLACSSSPAILPPPPPGQRPEPTRLEVLQEAGAANPGTIAAIPGFSASELGGSRDIWIYTPPGYAESQERFPVLYLHDGQNLFFNELSFTGEWMVDEIINGLLAEGSLPVLIVVGIANGGAARVKEYTPYATSFNGGESRADAYIEFLTGTLKPWVDTNYRTLPDAGHTALGGSSLGGLISLYAGLRHPEIFGSIMAMSPSLWVEDGAMLKDYRQAVFASPPPRFYLDMGTREGSTAASRQYNVDLVLALDEILRDRHSADVLALIDEGGEHHESAWSERLPDALLWLYGDLVAAPSP